MTVVAFGAMTLFGAAALAGERAHCITADIPQPVVLPDGSVHEPGSMRICLKRSYSPVAGLHEVSVGNTMEMLISRVEPTEGGTGTAMVFRRDEQKRYHLIGYTRRNGQSTMSYALKTFGPKSARQSRKLPLLLTASVDDRDDIVLVAAVQ
jgi:hypothetical protein